MTEAVAAPRPLEPSLEIRGVLRETWALYRDLFARSVLVGLLVFALLGVLDATSASGEPNVLLLFAALVLPVAGTALVQGALVNAVDDDRAQRPRRSPGALLAAVPLSCSRVSPHVRRCADRARSSAAAGGAFSASC